MDGSVLLSLIPIVAQLGHCLRLLAAVASGVQASGSLRGELLPITGRLYLAGQVSAGLCFVCADPVRVPYVSLCGDRINDTAPQSSALILHSTFAVLCEIRYAHLALDRS